MSNKYSLLFMLAFLAGSFTLSAQDSTATPKYGHMNLGNLLEELPATKTANDALKVVADSLGVLGDTMAVQFQREYVQLDSAYKAGLLTPVVAKQKEEELKKKQDEIVKFEQEAQAFLEKQRAELLNPILKDIETAVNAVAKENGYLMIFDVSSGVLLFADETDDVTPLVKAKLGMK